MNIVDSINMLYICLLIAASIYFLNKGHKGRKDAQVLKFWQIHREAWLRKNRINKLKQPDKL